MTCVCRAEVFMASLVEFDRCTIRLTVWESHSTGIGETCDFFDVVVLSRVPEITHFLNPLHVSY